MVVHVVYSTPEENISVKQVKSQIKMLNRDYSAKNPDKTATPTPWKGLIIDSRIRFALAKKDPEGKPATGITRTKADTALFGTHDEVKSSATGGADAWPTDKYLNLWGCALGGGMLGYAQFPGGPAATDGVVILNTAEHRVRHGRHCGCAVQPRPHRGPRGRPLAEPQSHLGRLE